jgi:resuscitation-promoting factor RpfB
MQDWQADTHPRRSETPTQPITRRWTVLAPALGVGIVSVMLVVGAAIVLMALVRTTPVTVVIDGEAVLASTRAATVGDLLAELGVAIDEGDTVSPPPNSPLSSEIVVRIERARSIMVTVNGETRYVFTPQTNPAEILALAGVEVGEQDRVLVDGTPTRPEELSTWPVPVTQLTVRHAVPLRIHDAGETQTVEATAETVGEALFDAGITLYLADTVTPNLNTPITPDLDIVIERARVVTITADGQTIETRTRARTVGGALAVAGITLAGLDYTIPSERDELGDETSITVIRVTEEIVLEERSLPYETVVQGDPALELDQSSVAQEGREGLEQTRIRVRYEDGVEVERLPESTYIVREPQNRVITYGTNVVVRTVDTPNGPRPYWRRLRLWATSYHPAALGGDNRTATGRLLEHGVVAADRGVLPFGTEIFVPGYGVGVVADTAPPRRDGMWVDLGYSDADYRPWARYVDVYVLGEPPASIDYSVGG